MLLHFSEGKPTYRGFGPVINSTARFAMVYTAIVSTLPCSLPLHPSSCDLQCMSLHALQSFMSPNYPGLSLSEPSTCSGFVFERGLNANSYICCLQYFPAFHPSLPTKSPEPLLQRTVGHNGAAHFSSLSLSLSFIRSLSSQASHETEAEARKPGKVASDSGTPTCEVPR